MKYIKAVFELKTIIKCNMLIYYLEKLPLFGIYISHFMFKHTELKKVAAIIASVFSIAALVIIKSLCILIFGLEGVQYLAEKLGLSIDFFDIYYFQSVFFLFCVLGAFQESRTFLVTKIKYLCLVHIKMPVKEGILAFLINEYFTQFISIGFTFYFFSILLHNKMYFYILLTAYISMQLLSECVHLAFFKQTGIPLEKKKAFSLCLFAVSLTGAYGPLVLSKNLLIEHFLTHKFLIFVYSIIGILSVYYIFFFFDAYNDQLLRIFKKEDLAEELARKKQEAINHTDIEIALISTQRIKKLQGYQFVNALFILRSKKHFFKYLKRRLIFVAAVFIFAFVRFFDHPSETKHILTNIYSFVPLLPVVIALYAYGEGFCKFYYNNFDSKLLIYRFYRTRKSILQNFFIKLRTMVKYNLLLGAVSAILLSALLCAAKIEIWNLSFLLLEITILVLHVVFGIQHLSVYYLLQPYIKESTMQNPILFMMQIPMLLLTYVFTILSLPAVITMSIFLFGSILYAFLLIVIVCIKSPATFTLK